MVWNRPASVPIPTVWARFEGKRPMKDGKVPKFWIQDVTDDMADRIVDFMSKNFALDEPMCNYTNLADDSAAMDDMKSRWYHSLESRIALVCFLVEEGADQKEPVIVGVNMNTHSNRHDKKNKQLSPVAQEVLGAVALVFNESGVFDKYGVDDIMTAYGLSVDREYRGQNIAKELLNARIPLCQAVGLKVTGSTFTAIVSQTLAMRCGFEDVLEISYKDLVEKYNFKFKDIETESIKYMALPIPQS